MADPRETADNGDEIGVNATLTSPISPDGTPEPGRRYEVPARQGRAVRVAAGQTITVINTTGSQVCDTWAFAAADLSEFMSMEHVRAWIDRIVPRPGDQLITNRRRAILTLIEDTSPGIHDTLIAACDIDRYRTLGVDGYHDNCSDNLRMAVKAIGARVREVPSPLNLWMNIPVNPDRSIGWGEPVSRPGDRVVLRAEIDAIVVLSACPQDLIPVNGADQTPKSVHFEVD